VVTENAAAPTQKATAAHRNAFMVFTIRCRGRAPASAHADWAPDLRASRCFRGDEGEAARGIDG
jgi:hypothetical protein